MQRLGPRRRIIKEIGEPVKLSTGKWVQKVELECSHMVNVARGYSANHRRCRPPKVANCLECEIQRDYISFNR